jgi:hypothetical protein
MALRIIAAADTQRSAPGPADATATAPAAAPSATRPTAPSATEAPMWVDAASGQVNAGAKSRTVSLSLVS